MNRRLVAWGVLVLAAAVVVVEARGPLGRFLGELREQLPELLENLPGYLGGHLLLSLAALAAGLAISLPLGVLASRRPAVRQWATGFFGVVQTVPTLALLALLVALVGRIGFRPAFAALVLYSVFPILEGTITGLAGVSSAVKEVARGMGMTERQVLFRVELPLARPSIFSGVRVATVLVVGTATLVTPVGGRSLGNYIFGGLESLNQQATVFGCVLAAALAILLDQLVRLLEVALNPRRPSRRLQVAAAAALLLLVGLGLYQPAARALVRPADRVVVASGPFTEQHILGAALAGELAQAGFSVEQRPGMSEGIQFQALFHGQVDCMVNYTGNVYTLLMKREVFPDRKQMLAEVTAYLREEHGVECLGPLGFQNDYAVAVPEATARGLNGSLAGLAGYAREHRRRTGKRPRLGSDNQFFDRPEWRWLRDRYELADLVETVAMEPTLMYGAARDGEVQLIVAYTTDGRIPAYGLTVLRDPEHVFPPYDAVLLLSPAASRRERLRERLTGLVGSLDLDVMRQANMMVDVDKRPARESAQWLLDNRKGHH
jgi:osmoprotectant transport system permease protein